MATTRVSKLSNDARLAHLHPIRFYLMRDDEIWRDIVEQHFADIQEDQSWAVMGVAERLYISHCEGSNLLVGLESFTFPEERLKRAFSEDFGSASSQLESAVLDWHGAGQQIFDLSPISAMFLASDALHTPVGRLKLPYESFFLHWGAHLEIPSPMVGRFIEGCYVSRNSHDIDLTFVSSIPESDPWDRRSLLANLVVDCEGVYSLLNEIRADVTFREMVAEVMDPEFAPASEVDRWSPYLGAAVNMLANCLCYLSSSKSEIEERYPPEAPERLVKQATTGSPRERARGESKLRNLGFRTIRLCGQRLAASIGLRPGTKDMPPHWRKGHWWPAHVGKGRAEVRMDWRNGVVVNAEQGQPKSGHIYKP